MQVCQIKNQKVSMTFYMCNRGIMKKYSFADFLKRGKPGQPGNLLSFSKSGGLQYVLYDDTLTFTVLQKLYFMISQTIN
jgi:hypothetical protein